MHTGLFPLATNQKPFKGQRIQTNTNMNKTIKYTVPTYALSAMINGDVSGLEDREVEAVDSFEAEIGKMSRNLGAESWSYDFSNESYFSHTNDVDSFGDDCVDCTVHFFYPLA